MLHISYQQYWRNNVDSKHPLYRSSHRRCSVRTSVFTNFANFTGNTCAGVSFQLSSFIKRDFLRTPILKNICERLLLYVVFNFNSWSVGVLGLGASENFLNILDWKKLFSICWSSLAQNIIIITNIIIIIFSSFAIMSAFPSA